MQLSSLLFAPLLLASSVIAQSGFINITTRNTVDQILREGELAYGATNLWNGYSAGAGINFSDRNETVGGGFNAGIPDKTDGALGGGWTLTGSNLTFGFGAVVNNKSIDISLVADLTTGVNTLMVNGKEVVM